MKRLTLYLAMLFVFSGLNSHAGVNIDINIDGSASDNYYRSIADYHRVSERDVYYVRQRGIPDEELPVIFYLASLAGVAPRLVADEYRKPGISLYDLTTIFGLGPDVYYYPVKVKVDGPPYGKAYGYYKNKPKKEWKNIKLSNSDIINLVNLRFISESRGVDPEDIINRRKSGKNFITIDYDITKDKGKSKNNGGRKDFDNSNSGKNNKGKGNKEIEKSSKEKGPGNSENKSGSPGNGKGKEKGKKK